MNPTISLGGPSPETRSGQAVSIFLWAVFSLVILVIPALLFSNLLVELAGNLRASRENRQEERAGELLAKLDRTINLEGILRRALTKFTGRAERFLRGKRIDSAGVIRIAKAFRKQFPRQTVLRWYDGDGRFMPVEGTPEQGARAWQFFFDTLTDKPGLSAIASMTAGNMIRSLMGQLISMDVLKKVQREPITVLYNGHPHLFVQIRLHAATLHGKHSQTALHPSSFSGFPEKHVGIRPLAATPSTLLGSLIAFIPLDLARPGWELDYAVRALQKSNRKLDVQFGGVWQSTQIGTGTDRLDPGFLNGLWNYLRNGKTRYADQDHVFLFRLRSSDPDLMIVAGCGKPNDWTSHAEASIHLLLVFLPLAVILSALFALARVLGRFSFASDLRTKFAIGTALLAGMPLAALAVTGLNHLVLLDQTRIFETERRLESLLDEFEQVASEETVLAGKEVRSFIGRLLKESDGSMDAALLKHFSQELKRKFGMERLFFVRRGCQPIVIGNVLVGVQSSFHRSFVSEVLQKFHFRYEDKGFKGTMSPEFKVLIDSYTAEEMGLMFGRMQSLSFGTGASMFFQVFEKKQGSDVYQAFISTEFNVSTFRKNQIANARRRLFQKGLVRPEHFSLRILDFHTSHLFESPQQRLKTALDLSESVGGRLRITEDLNGEPHVILARQLQTLGSVVAIALPTSLFSEAYHQAGRLLFLLIILATSGALLASRLLPRFLLNPLLEIGNALSAVDRGEYAITAPVRAPDEIGTLAESLNLMVEGLRQKERMSTFVRRDLVEEIAQTGSGKDTSAVVRQNVTVSFSGLRRFAVFERDLPSEEAMAFMSRFLGLCTTCVKAHGGEIDKFIGDAAMAVFRDHPGESDGRPPAGQRAAAAAFDLQRSFNAWMKERSEKGLPTVQFGVGIAAGEVLAGRIGSFRKRLDFTVIGDAVNLAARLEKLAGSEGRPTILALSDACETIAPSIKKIPTPIVGVRGRRGEITVFGLLEGDAHV
ncbi:MAG: adenylate/guanylate cyclase domain-containing protein [Candidatus Ozemobacteraceae bacterium]